ncbi:MAG: DinB family protein [Anaerolineales bacterium]|jgi:uncharacterized damage-inducible protein DinB
MQPFFEAYLNNLQELHHDIQSTLKELPPAALDWAPPGSGFNSLSVLIVHLTGAQRYWLGDVVAREPSDRNREAEFQVRELSLDGLTKRLDDSLDYVHRVLENLTLPDLETSRVSSRNGREVTVAWALAHALKHTALHVGHIQITRQLWEQQKGNNR